MGKLEDELRTLIKEKFEGVPKFADSIGEPPTSIYGALSRGMKNTRTELTNKIYRGLNVDMNSVSGAFYKLELLEASSSGNVDVPLLGSIAAGTPIEMIETDNSHPVPAKVMERYPNAKLLEVKGNSMNKILPNGSYALVNPCSEVDRDNQPYAVCVNGYDATIKRVHKLDNGFELVPDSTDPTFKPKVYDYGEPGTETITIIGRVVYHVLPFDWSY